MRRISLALLMAIFVSSRALGQGLLIPTDEKMAPLGIVYQRVNVTIQEQAAVTRIEQEFFNPTSQSLEAIYLFPIPASASVQDFAMWIDGKRTKGEIVEAAQARQVYSDIVRRLKDPGLLERMDDRLLRVRVFPVPPQGKQKIEVAYNEIVKKDGGIAEYNYPIRVGTREMATQEDFTIRIELNSSTPIQNVYSPSHEVGISKEGDRRAIVGFEKKNYVLNKDFQLFWTTSEKEVGFSVLTHRTSPGEDGYALILISPNEELSATERVPRDLVFVVDTSGSMAGEKMDQAKSALEYCVKSLDPADRFNIVRFATTTEKFEGDLQPVNDETRTKATAWIKGLSAVGGTAISDALDVALSLRKEDARNFTIVFLTDGQPTIGNTDPKAILDRFMQRNTNSTRLFAFGVGDDVNTHLLDQVAEKTKGTSVYVRPKENLEVKVSSFYAKISHPVLADLSLALGSESIKLKETYPPKLPDLFHGSQLVVLTRYTGAGETKIKLSGKLGSAEKSFEFDASLPQEKQQDDFIATLWAQRKVGYILDQIRLSGESKELVDEVVAVAKKFGIVTPYTSYLLTPDEKLPIAMHPPTHPPIIPFPGPQPRAGVDLSGAGFGIGGGGSPASAPNGRGVVMDEKSARQQSSLGRKESRDKLRADAGNDAVSNAQTLDELKNALQQQTAVVQSQNVAGKLFQNVSGVWVDNTFNVKEPVVRVKYLSEAYFQLVNSRADVRKVLAQGERVIWRTPTGQTLVIDGEGKETLSADEVKGLLGG